jgi:hypothetical protein
MLYAPPNKLSKLIDWHYRKLTNIVNRKVKTFTFCIFTNLTSPSFKISLSIFISFLSWNLLFPFLQKNQTVLFRKFVKYRDHKNKF